MFILDEKTNRIKEIKPSKFHDLQLSETKHLQEWIANNPTCLLEELLIIQKEFSGFSETNERLDLLALDKDGRLVIIENKLDDTGKDVVWQALKYVSYCSTLTKLQIKEIYQSYLDKQNIGTTAEESLSDFYNGKPFAELSLNDDDQRIILIAGNFRKEVTSTVMWMLNHGISVQCFKITPFKYDYQVFLDLEQIIPVKEAEDYIIKMADKNREEKESKDTNRGIEELRKEFWIELLSKFNSVSNQYKNISPTTDHWLSNGSGVSGVVFAFVATTAYASVDLTINWGSQEENKKLFDLLKEESVEIERDFAIGLLEWQRLDNKKSCRITYRNSDFNIMNREQWPDMIDFLSNAMPRFEKALKEKIKNATSKL